jgi:hypothetical protein
MLRRLLIWLLDSPAAPWAAVALFLGGSLWFLAAWVGSWGR